MKIVHGDEPSFVTRWNPFAQTNTHMFTSHHLAYNDKERETVTYNCDDFIESLDAGKNSNFFLSLLQLHFFFYFTVLNTYRRNRNESKLEFIEDRLLVPSYASLGSILFNQNYLGFNRDRNGVNW